MGETQLLRVAVLAVAGLFSVPAAMSALHHHAREAAGWLIGYAGMGALVLISWLRDVDR